MFFIVLAFHLKGTGAWNERGLLFFERILRPASDGFSPLSQKA